MLHWNKKDIKSSQTTNGDYYILQYWLYKLTVLIQKGDLGIFLKKEFEKTHQSQELGAEINSNLFEKNSYLKHVHFINIHCYLLPSL